MPKPDKIDLNTIILISQYAKSSLRARIRSSQSLKTSDSTQRQSNLPDYCPIGFENSDSISLKTPDIDGSRNLSNFVLYFSSCRRRLM